MPVRPKTTARLREHLFPKGVLPERIRAEPEESVG